MSRGRGGALLLEVLLALALGAVVLAAFTGVLVSSLQWARSLALRAEALEVVRTVWVVMDEEVRPGLAGRDWRVEDGVVSLRAFRGLARVCANAGGTDRWAVAYRGRRLPDPDRDSVLVLGADGGWRSFDLEWSGSGDDCGLERGERAFEWRWPNGFEPAPVLVRLYERGEYHLADGALRYRRGDGGRQPLTPERLASGSAFTGRSDGRLEVQLELRPLRPTVDPELFSWTATGRVPEGR